MSVTERSVKLDQAVSLILICEVDRPGRSPTRWADEIGLLLDTPGWEEAYERAAKQLGCSVDDLEYE